MKLSAAIGADLSQLRRDFQTAERLAQQTADRIDGIFARAQGMRFNVPTLSGFNAQTSKLSTGLKGLGAAAQQVGSGLLPISAGLLGIGAAAAKSAIEIDKQVNSLKAFTGSAQAAEARFKALFDLAQRTPGLTTNLGLSLDAQLRAVGATEQAIDRLLPAIGRLNAVSPLGDPQKFGRNLVQLVTQNFERIDLKELVGQSPIAGQLIKEIFNVDSAIDGKAIRESARKLGITTIDSFAKAFSDAAQNNPAISGATESISTQIEKLQDRVGVALRPLGLKILQAIVPALERLVPTVESLLDKFNGLPPATQNSILAMGGLAIAAGPVLIGFGSLLKTAGTLAGTFGILRGAAGLAAGSAGIGGLSAAASTLAPVLIPLGVLVAGLAAGWITDFGGMRDATANAFNRIMQEFDRLKPVRNQVSKDLKGIQDEFQIWSDQSRPIIQSFWQFFSEVASGYIAQTSQQVSGIISMFNGLLSGLNQQFLSPASRALSAVLGADPALPANPLRPPGRAPISISGSMGPGAALPEEMIPLWRQQQIANEARANRNRTSTGGRSGSGRRKELTELQQERQTLARLNRDIAIFRDLTSEEFKLRVQIEEKQDLRSQLAQILSLRKELGEPIAVRFPDTSAAANLELKRLNALKSAQEALANQDTTELLQVKANADAAGMNKALTAFQEVQRELRLVGASEIERAGFEIGDKFAEAMALAISQGRGDIVDSINKIIDAAKQETRDRQDQQRAETTTSGAFNNLETARTAIQNQLNAGLLSEIEARRRQIQVEKEHRNEILSALLSERALAEARGDTAAVSRISVEVERANGLGAQRVNEEFQGVKAALSQGFDDVIGSLLRGGDGLKSALLNTLNGVLNSLVSGLLEKATDGAASSFGGLLANAIGGLFGFADGGRPPLGVASIVGERGPELFVPDTAGTIFNKQQIAAMAAGAGGTTINAPINVTVNSRNGNVPRETRYQIARQVQQAVEAARQRG